MYLDYEILIDKVESEDLQKKLHKLNQMSKLTGSTCKGVELKDFKEVLKGIGRITQYYVHGNKIGYFKDGYNHGKGISIN